MNYSNNFYCSANNSQPQSMHANVPSRPIYYENYPPMPSTSSYYQQPPPPQFNVYYNQSADPRLSRPISVLTSRFPFPLQTDLDINKTDDELWIETWLSRIGKIDINLDSTCVKSVDTRKKIRRTGMPINMAKSSLTSCLSILNKLTKTQQELQDRVETLSSAEWRKKTIEIGELKDQFTKEMGKFDSPEIVAFLRRAVQKRRKKRLAVKRRKAKKHEEHAKEAEKLKKMDKDADMWLESMKDEVERAKMEEHFKKDADCILAEVTKKKSDARKQLSLIQSLIKLRSVREQAAVNIGEKVSLEDSRAFSRVTGKLLTMWEDLHKVYTKEEQGLKLMLEQNASEDSKAAKTKKENVIVKGWHHLLFGPRYTPKPNDHMYWALTAAERDMEAFIAIRRSWDTFLVPSTDESGSNIPIGWVLPESNADRWNRYLQR